MNSLAEQALEHASLRLAGQPKKRPTSKVGKIRTPPPACTVRSLEVVVNGPINRFMFMQGRAWAVDMVTSLRASPVQIVIERLAGAASDRPGSYAAGIDSVIKQLKEARR